MKPILIPVLNAVAYYKKKKVAIFTNVYLEIRNHYIDDLLGDFRSVYMDAELVSDKFEKYNIDENTRLNVIIDCKDAIIEGDFCIRQDGDSNKYFFELIGALGFELIGALGKTS